mgnify:FL=1
MGRRVTLLFMARVDHKKIRQLIAQKQKTVTDRQFFSSRAFAAYFADMALAQTRRYGYHRRVKVRTVWEPKNGNTAMTNNELIWLNAGHPSITQHKSRAERYAQLCGLFAHELGHVLYTDFITSQTHLTRLDSGFWYPEPPPLRTSREQHAEEELWDYSGDSRKHQSMVRFIMHDIMNILEDGYIEQRMIAEYPGVLGQNLQARRASTFADMPTLSQVIENEPEQGHVWLTIQQALLSYMKWGELKYGDTPLTDERVQVVFGLLPELDKALLSRDLRDRCRAANLIMVRCWHYIKDFLDHCEEMAEQATPGGDDSVAVGILQQLVSALAGASAAAEGSSAPATGAPGKAAPPTSGSTAANRAKTAMLAAQAAEESEEETENTAGSATGAEEQEGDDGTESPTPLGTSEDDEENGSNGSGGLGDELSAGSSDNQQPSNCQTVSDTEQGRLPQRQTDTLSVPEGGTTEHDDTYRGTGYANAASDIARILEAVAEDAVHTSLEKERKRELNELAQSISYGNIHNGVNMTVHRICEVEPELRDEYDEVADDLLHISRQLQKSVTQKLEDSRRGGKQTSLLMGRRLDAHAIARLDGRVFCKNALPNEAPALSVGLLLDESGSMCSCDRATYARATAIILYDFCRALDIPIMVYGHSTSSGCVDLYSYAEFDAIDRDDRYRLMDISSRGSNRDGAALRYVAEQLAKRTEDVKILMLVSDGQPADSGYYGTAAEEDLRGVKQEYQRKGILFVAAAIGADKDNIERIYGDSFLDITDLNKLPVKLAGIIKRYIR